MQITLTSLVVPRLRRVARSLTAASEDKSFIKTLHPDTRAQLMASVSIGERLDTALDLSPLVIDTVTDSVIGSFESALVMFERIANDRVVRPSQDALDKKADAMTLRQLAFPQSAQRLLDLEMVDQHKAMVDLNAVLTEDKTAVACVKRLGLEWAVAQIVAHLAPYSRAVRASDGRDVTGDSEAFHAAFTKLAISASAHHAGDETVHKTLFGTYDDELEAQQRDARDRRKRAAAKPETK
jgi:hypothetical protein